MLFCVESYNLNVAETPCLTKLFSRPSKVSKYHLNAVLLEIYKVMGTKKNTIDFEYNNGTKGCAILIPKVKNEESLKKKQLKR